ncbi:DUF2845 domain-containing protein [Hydrocarboniphaga sp.]|uniref:DUF2845 domain-containing protein n=1 Tax=Hydrocarboniphaga sp. TaxID=2033016 RepID=UPI0026126F68|nr:DUF2845 domain-containing protein [Hydrocarboniphaga sp.]
MPIALLALSVPAHAGDTMRCGSRLVAVEARAAELLSTCGAPAYRDVWSEQTLAPGAVAEQEEWTYNFGPQQLLRVVRLRNARVVDIDSDGYGFAEPDERERRCSPEHLIEGMSKYRLLMACGAPLTRTVAQTFFLPYRPTYRNGYPVQADRPVLQVFREEWVYDFGPNLFMRVLRLENGRVTQIENGERGSSRR